MKTTITINTPDNTFDSDVKNQFQDFFGRVIADIKCDIISDTIGLCGQYELETAEMLRDAFLSCKIETLDDTQTQKDELIRTDEGKLYRMLESGDIERCFAFNISKGKVTLLADLEKGGEDDSTSRIESMRFAFPESWNNQPAISAVVNIRGQYSGGITAEDYDNKVEAVKDFMSQYDGLVVRQYLAADNVKLSALSALPDGIAYVYFKSKQEALNPNLSAAFSDTIKRNYLDFEEDMKTYSGKIVYDCAYEIVTKSEITAYVESTDLGLTEKEYKALLSSKNPLDEIYETIRDNDQFRSYDDIGEAIKLTVEDIQKSMSRKTDQTIDSFMSSSGEPLDLTGQNKLDR